MRSITVCICSVVCVLVGADSRADDLSQLGFGAALSFKWHRPAPKDGDLVGEAIIDPQGIVRVTKRVNTSAGFMFDMHYYAKQALCTDDASDSGKRICNFGIGPFVAVQPGSDAIITSIGAGAMMGWRKDGGKGFGIGFGRAATPSAKVLGGGFVADQAAPKGATEVRLDERDKSSWLFLSSFTF